MELSTTIVPGDALSRRRPWIDARRTLPQYAWPVSEPSPRRVVWVVDDSRLDVERAARALSRDYGVETFCDGSAVLERLASHEPPDVLVLDWVMPGVSGVEVCSFLRARGGQEGLAILLLTAHRHTEQIVAGLSAGADDYLAKPYEDEELRARVAALVRWRALLERAEKAEAAHRRLLETVPDPLLVANERGVLVFVNDKATQALGRPATQLLGSALGGLVPKLARVHEHTPGESLLPMGDVTIGSRRFSPTINAGRNSNTILLRDVTERRLLEERRLDFYSIIAHDLRTPLAAMTLRIGLLAQGDTLDSVPRAKQDVIKLQERLKSLVSMINDFLELASLEGASYRLHDAEVNLGALIGEVVEEFRPLLERGGQTWTGITGSAADAVVTGDPKRLTQVLSNLLGNAIKFTPAGGEISAEIVTTPRFVEVSIRDTGVGIAAPALATLFGRYTRAEHAVGGTGLGLMIVKEIVEAHGGVVGVESALGQGSRFWLRLPRRRLEA
jgi:signal transduction histidine kinase